MYNYLMLHLIDSVFLITSTYSARNLTSHSCMNLSLVLLAIIPHFVGTTLSETQVLLAAFSLLFSIERLQ